jgi:hypothetical protein
MDIAKTGVDIATELAGVGVKIRDAADAASAGEHGRRRGRSRNIPAGLEVVRAREADRQD